MSTPAGTAQAQSAVFQSGPVYALHGFDCRRFHKEQPATLKRSRFEKGGRACVQGWPPCRGQSPRLRGQSQVFDLLIMPGEGHSPQVPAGRYYDDDVRRFFVEKLGGPLAIP
jgi:hypothetical protein